jgi:hypothetical protein
MIQAPEAWTIKHITFVIVAVSGKAKVFAAAFHFQPNLIFAGKAGAYLSGTLMVGSKPCQQQE